MSTTQTIRVALGALALVVLVGGIALVAVTASAQDWPMYGRDLSNRADTTCPAPATSDVLWEFLSDDEIQSAPVIVDGRVYFINESGSFHCLDGSDGTEIWSVDLAGRWNDSTPAVVDGFVYVATYNDEIYCYDTDGNWQWDIDLPGDDYILSSSPTIAGGNLYIGTDDNYVYCLDIADGNIKWSFDSDGQIHTSQAVDEGYQAVYVTTLQGGSPDNFFCLPMEDPDSSGEIETDEVLWSYQADDSIQSTPVLHEECVYFVDYQGTLYRLYADPAYENDRVGGKWAIAGGACWGAPAVHGQWMCFGSDDHFIYLVDPYNGEVQWKYETDGVVRAVPAFADDKVYICASSNDWDLYCFDYRDGDLIWTDNRYSYMRGSPAIADGVLYIGDTGGNRGRLVAYAQEGTVQVSAHPGHMPQDAFPAQGLLDLVDLSTNSVRFDAALDPNLTDGVNAAEDSVTFRVTLTALGAVLAAPPTINYHLQRNTLFDDHRTSGLPDVGTLWCDNISTVSTVPYARYDCRFDLPDEGFLFPGDVMHYYVEATDGVSTGTLPTDLSDYGDFGLDSSYDRRFTFCALPSVQDVLGDQPSVLVMNYAEEEGMDLRRAMTELGCAPGQDYDLWYMQAARSRVGNNLGGRATPPLLAGYECILLDCGGQFMSLGNDLEYGDDIALMYGWRAIGGDRSMAYIGVNLASMLAGTVDGPIYLAVEMGVGVTSGNATNATDWVSPDFDLIQPPVTLYFLVTDLYSHTGGVARLPYDDLTALMPAVVTHQIIPRLPSAPIAGGILYDRLVGMDHYMDLTMPLPFSSIASQVEEGQVMTAQARLLEEILVAFNQYPGSAPPTAADQPPGKTVLHPVRPNPFNPRCMVSFELPRDSGVRLRVFDLRGRLVRTLLEDEVEKARIDLPFDGRDDAGRTLASGVYLIRLEADGTTQTRKVALVR